MALHTPNLLLQAALVSTIHPGQSSSSGASAGTSEATKYLQSWVESDDGAVAAATTDPNSHINTGAGTSWTAAAELIASFYPVAGGAGNAFVDPGPGSSSDHAYANMRVGVVERAIIAHHESARQAASSTGTKLSDRFLKTTASGVRSLLLTLLNTKIRTSTTGTIPIDVMGKMIEGVWSGLIWLGSLDEGASAASSPTNNGEIRLLCATAGALAVRVAGGVPVLVQNAFAGTMQGNASVMSTGANSTAPSAAPPTGALTPALALKVLSRIPSAAADCPSRRTADIEADLKQCLGYVLEMVDMALAVAGNTAGGISASNGNNIMKLALQVLRNWAGPCDITLTQLSTAPSPDRPSLLDILVRILSTPESQQLQQQSTPLDVLDVAAQALLASVVEGSDLGTPSRLSVATALLGAIPTRGFLVHPLTVASEAVWEGDECVCSLANLAVSIVTEEIDLVVACAVPGCTELIEILMGIQVHRVQRAAISPLEAWLAIQDIPLSNRHPILNKELFARVVQALLVRISYPFDFTSWEEDGGDTLDRQEFEEMRRLASDVLTSAYFLLRVDYIDGVISSVMTRQNSWEAIEAALFCLCAVARDVSDEVKRKTDGGIKTAEKLVSMVQQLYSVPLDQQLICLRKAIAAFLGVYACVWDRFASDSILQVLSYLNACIENGASHEGAKAVRLIMIGSGKSLVSTATQSPEIVSSALTAVMNAGLTHGEEGSIRLIAEGLTRFCMTIPDTALVRSSLIAVSEPIVRCSSTALEYIQSAQTQQRPDPAQLESCCRSLSHGLNGFEEVCRFCDDHSPPPSSGSSESSNNSSHPLSDVLAGVWPILTGISASPMCRSHDDIMSSCLAVHSTLLSSAPDLIAPHFAATVTFIVQLYEEQHSASALDYVAAAVEHFGSTNGGDCGDLGSFTELLAHVTRCTFSYVTTQRQPRECPVLIEAYFDACRRYLLFCPKALMTCQEFGNIFGLGVACLNECLGNDCRAALLFLAQIIGYKNLRVSTDTTLALQAASSAIDSLISQHGEAICKTCVSSLSGAAPQILWPAYSECLYATLSYLCSVDGGENLAYQLMNASLEEDAKRLAANTRQNLVSILLGYAKDSANRRSKPQAKLLLADYGKLCKGEATVEILQAYVT